MSAFNKNNILDILCSNFNNKLTEIIDSIATEYNLDKEKLISKYIGDVSDISEILDDKKKKRKKNKVLNSEELCMAKKADNNQCTRRRKPNCDYCGKHQNNLKFGRIDDEEKFNDNSKYIRTLHERIGGEDYLIDDNNILYTFDKENPTVLGRKVDGKVVLDT